MRAPSETKTESTEPLPPECRTWLDEFRRLQGRSPRVLHVGNIANNAFHNARLLNRAGLDCDVVCYDYYHIMGCPEWEEADFEGEVGDHFRPNWAALNLNGYRRPLWFAQGPLHLCQQYLIARRRGEMERAGCLWNRLLVSSKVRPTSARWSRRFLKHTSTLFRVGLNALDRPLHYGPIVMASLRNSAVRLWKGESAFSSADASLVTLMALAAPLGLSLWPVRKLLRREIDARVRNLRARFQVEYPTRPDPLSGRDMARYSGRADVVSWKRLFRRYDIVQAYSTDPAWPLLTGVPYFAFEHGTLREIPFQETAQGRVTALSYRLAEHVFVTNADCLENARRLAGERVTFLNHPYDEDDGLRVEGWQALRRSIQHDLRCELIFFFPTRHDWIPGTGYADKANDSFLRAFARLRAKGFRVGLICCRWGANVRESQALIEELGYQESVRWVEPMGVLRFNRTARAAHVVVDQFALGTFGGVMFKALACGAAVCSYLNVEELRSRYAEPPPIINGRTEEEIAAELHRYLTHPEQLVDLGAQARRWVKKYHSSAETVAWQFKAYQKFLEPKQSTQMLPGFGLLDART